ARKRRAAEGPQASGPASRRCLWAPRGTLRMDHSRCRAGDLLRVLCDGFKSDQRLGARPGDHHLYRAGLRCHRPDDRCPGRRHRSEREDSSSRGTRRHGAEFFGTLGEA
ncbi:unnamed protein product, partial [Symbiodinium sp. CCMP2456]